MVTIILARLTSNNIDNTGLYHVEDIQQRIKLIDRLIFDKDISFPQDGIASFIKSGLITDPADARLLDKGQQKDLLRDNRAKLFGYINRVLF